MEDGGKTSQKNIDGVLEVKWKYVFFWGFNVLQNKVFWDNETPSVLDAWSVSE